MHAYNLNINEKLKKVKDFSLWKQPRIGLVEQNVNYLKTDISF